jgi:glutamate/tyrosine decarboxylase-like PLP-dependent enzyme
VCISRKVSRVMHDDVLRRVLELAVSWLRSLPERPVGVPVEADALRAQLDTTLPDEGEDAATVLERLAAALEPGLVATGGPRYFGFVTGGSLPAALAADWLVSTFDQNSAAYVMSPAAAVMEETAGAWVLELLGLPAGSAVGFVTGGQMANFSCLAAARHALLAGEGWDVEADGLSGAPIDRGRRRARSLDRDPGAASARARFETRPANPHRRPGAHAARRAPGCARQDRRHGAGVCASGARSIAARWTHWSRSPMWSASRTGRGCTSTAPFGLWAAASAEQRPLLAGAELADSWAVDGHKWLNVPYDCGMAIVRDPAAATAALTVSAPYLAVDTRDPSAFTPESSRRARAVPVYAALSALGRRGLAELVNRCCTLARQAADELALCPQVEVLNDVVLNQVLFRVHDVDTATIIERVQQDGTCWIGGTTWHDQPAIRLSVSNWSTTENDISRSVAAITTAIETIP